MYWGGMCHPIIIFYKLRILLNTNAGLAERSIADVLKTSVRDERTQGLNP